MSFAYLLLLHQNFKIRINFKFLLYLKIDQPHLYYKTTKESYKPNMLRASIRQPKNMLKLLFTAAVSNVKLTKKTISITPISMQTTNFFFSNNKMTPQQYQKLKQSSKQFYNNQVDQIVDLEKSQDWEKVMPGFTDPVIVDFYADWCQPCKQLTPRLQEKIKSSKKLKMVKINVDRCPQIAHALQIKSVPTVYLIYQGQALDRIQGNASDEILEKFFNNADKLMQKMDETNKKVKLLDEAKILMSQNKFDKAREVLISIGAHTNKPINAIKEIFLSQCHLSLNDVSKFVSSIETLTQYKQIYEGDQDLQKFYEYLQQQCKNIEQATKQDPEMMQAINKLKSDPSNLSLKYELCLVLKKHNLIEEALQSAIQIIKEDKNWQEKKANKFVLQIFKELGNNSPVTQKYRKIFQRLLH